MRFFYTTIFFITTLNVFAQYGGSYTYAYLNLPPSARIAALGGTNVSMLNDDVNFGMMNPALYNEQMDAVVSASHAIVTGNIQHGYVSAAKYLSKIDATLGGGIFYRSYGRMAFTDETGTQLGGFQASEYILQSGIAHRENKLSYGANIKVLYSQLESYQSLGAAIDIGGSFADTARQFYMGIVFKNIGTQFIAYTPQNYEELPFELQFGISKRLQHLPLMFSITGHNLQTYDIKYDDPAVNENTNIFSSDTVESEPEKFTGDKILRHLIVGGEFYFGKNFSVRAGYDHLTRRELSLTTKRGLTGFSMGFGLKIKKYQLDYTHEFYSVAGGNNMITLSANLHQFMKL